MRHVERQLEADPYHLAAKQGKVFSFQSRHVSGFKPQPKREKTCSYSFQQRRQSTFEQHHSRNVRAEPRRHYKIYSQVT